MSSDSDRLLPVKIFNIYPYADVQQGAGGPNNFLVFLKGEESRVVPITIGSFEGQALAMALKKIPLPRPLPHNLLQNLLERLHATVHKLVIHTLKEDVFHAYLLIQTTDDTFYLDCRPSDGMILATLTNTPLYMSPEVMEEAGRTLELEPEQQAEAEESEEDGCPANESVSGLAGTRCAGEPEAGESDTGVPADDAQLTEIEQLKARLTRLIAEEAYEEAARVRDKISQLEHD